MMQNLFGKKGLVVGIANEDSIAWGCAQAFYKAGATLGITYKNEKIEQSVRPLAEQVKANILMPLDVTNDEEIMQVFEQIKKVWGQLDFLLHAVAYAPKQDLQGRVVDCSRDGFLLSLNVSCYSFIRLAHFATPLMSQGGCLLTTTYYGGERVIEHYNIMGPVKAALEGSVIYLAQELGKEKIRVNAISPGPIMTRAASGLPQFDLLLRKSKEASPMHESLTIQDVGELATFLVSDHARHITGNIMFVDSGFHIIGV